MRRILSAAATTTMLLTMASVLGAPAASADNDAPGSFTGYGFDACTAPAQATMDAWRATSKFSAVGIYISGNSRGCTQSSLTSDWVRTQAQRGWRFMPLHVGFQAPCFPSDSKRHMSSRPAEAYRQGLSSASNSATAARALGLPRSSHLYLDIEAYPIDQQNCNTATLRFMDAWTKRLHHLGYASGVYSSAGAAITALENVRTHPVANRGYHLPDNVFVARWNGDASTSVPPYLAPGGWSDHQRIHQYVGPHTETHGGTTLAIDSDFLDVGNGSVGPAPVDQCFTPNVPAYDPQSSGDHDRQVKVVKCLLKRRGLYAGPITKTYGQRLVEAVLTFQESRGQAMTGGVRRQTWVSMLSAGGHGVLKYGSTGQQVYRLQRSLRAADLEVPMTGRFGKPTLTAVHRYRRQVGLPTWPTAEPRLWQRLHAGRA